MTAEQSEPTPGRPTVAARSRRSGWTIAGHAGLAAVLVAVDVFVAFIGLLAAIEICFGTCREGAWYGWLIIGLAAVSALAAVVGAIRGSSRWFAAAAVVPASFAGLWTFGSFVSGAF